MSEGRKRCRKSKLEVRDDADVEETQNTILQTLSEQNVGHLKLPQPITSMFDHTYSLPNVPAPPSPIKLSVKVEVEEFDESIMGVDNDDANESTTMKSLTTSDFKPIQRRRHKSFIHVFHVNLDKMFKISDHIIWSSTNPADKYLSIELKNIWGRVLNPVEDDDPYNELIQKALYLWGIGLANNKSQKESPLYYQCRLCNLAWWYCGPFRDHIRHHDHKLLNVFHMESYVESVIIASRDFSNQRMSIRCEGDCYRCGKGFDYHKTLLKLNTQNPYRCKECCDTVSTCSNLVNHEPVCYTMKRTKYPKAKKCSLCTTYFLNNQDLKAHMSKVHVVRSDIPIPFSFKICATCQKKYHHYNTHMCIKSSKNSSCKHCYRKFATKTLADFHMLMGEKDYQCNICIKMLPNKCMATEHMLFHTDKYRMVYKCSNPICSPTMLFPDEASVKLHKTIFHRQKYDKRRTYFELVLIPEQCVKPELVEDSEHVGTCTFETKGLKAVSFVDLYKNLEQNNATSVQTDKQKCEVILQEDISIRKEIQSMIKMEHTDGDSQDSEMDYEQMLSKVFKVSDSKQKKKFSGREQITKFSGRDQITKFSGRDQTTKFSGRDQITKFSGSEQTASEVSGYEQTLSKIFQVSGSEQSLMKVSKTSNSAQNSLPFMGSMEIQIKAEPEEIDFEDLIDIHNNPITVKEEPMETYQFDEMSAKEPCAINTSSINEFDIDGACNIKTKPQECEIDGIYYNHVIDMTAVKMKPDDDEMMMMNNKKNDLQQELLEATDVKIMETFTALEAAIIKTPPKIKPIARKRKQKPTKIVKALNKKSLLKNNIVIPKDFQVNVIENTWDQNVLSRTIEKNVTDTLVQNVPINVEVNVTENSANQNVFSINIEGNVIENTSDQNVFSTSIEGNTTDNTSDQNELSKNVKENTTAQNEFSINVEKNVIEYNTDQNKTKKTVPNILIKKSKLSKRFRMQHIYTCVRCGYSNTYKLYRLHVKSKCEILTTADGPNKYTCTKCDTSFSTLKWYLMHFHNHGYEVLHCPSCNVKFESFKNLLMHFHKHVRNNFVNFWMINKKLDMPTKKQHRCQICREVVPQECLFPHWESHLQLKSNNKLEPEPMEVNMDASTTDSSSSKLLQPAVLSVALRELRRPSREKECFVCFRKFTRRHDCKRHVIEHLLLDAYSRKEGTPDKTLRCQICSEDFNRADQYKFHMREHGCLPVYRCDLCNKTFSDSSNFAKHKKIHSSKLLICDICQKKFHAKSSLEKHMLMHRYTEPIKCEMCEKLFHTLSSYKKHMKIRHVRTIKFKCILCDIYFDSLRKKWDHNWTVHKERKDKADCPICRKAFRKFLDVKTHARSEHKVELSFYNVKSDDNVKLKRLCKIRKLQEETLVISELVDETPRKTRCSVQRKKKKIT